jgi:hypothetical protein
MSKGEPLIVMPNVFLKERPRKVKVYSRSRAKAGLDRSDFERIQ